MALGPAIATNLMNHMLGYDDTYYIEHSDSYLPGICFPWNRNHACHFPGATDKYRWPVIWGHAQLKEIALLCTEAGWCGTHGALCGVMNYVVRYNGSTKQGKKIPIIFLHKPHITRQIIIERHLCEATRSPVKLYSDRRGTDREWQCTYDKLVYLL